MKFNIFMSDIPQKQLDHSTFFAKAVPLTPHNFPPLR